MSGFIMMVRSDQVLQVLPLPDGMEEGAAFSIPGPGVQLDVLGGATLIFDARAIEQLLTVLHQARASRLTQEAPHASSSPTYVQIAAELFRSLEAKARQAEAELERERARALTFHQALEGERKHTAILSRANEEQERRLLARRIEIQEYRRGLIEVLAEISSGRAQITQNHRSPACERAQAVLDRRLPAGAEPVPAGARQ